jgi:hypothetical protein
LRSKEQSSTKQVGPMRILSPRLIYLLLAASTMACGADLTLPADASPARLQAVSGSGQEGTVGTPLPNPLVVRLTDGAGRQVAKVPVTFRFQSEVPGARFQPSVVATDDTGFASVQVVLGTTPGAQTVEAAVAASPSADLLATFGVTVLASRNGGGSQPGKPSKPSKPGKGGGHGHDDEDD